MPNKINNSVKATVSKTPRRVSPKIKNEIKDENNKKKIIIVALILALLLAMIAYAKISKKDDVETDNKEEKEQIIEKKEETEKEEEKDDESASDVTSKSTASATENVISVIETVTSKASDDVKVIETNNKVDNNTSNKEEESSGDVYYAITFETNGGDKLDKQILTQNEVTTSVVPTKEGWSFAGWYEDEGLNDEFVFGKTLTADKTIYAKWVKFFKFMTMDGGEFGTTQSVYGREVNLLSKEDLGDFFEENDDCEIIWNTEINNGNDEFELNELKPGTMLTDGILPNDDTINLYLDTLKRFDLLFFEDEESDEPIHTERVLEKSKVDFTGANNAIIQKYSLEDASFGWYYKAEDGSRVNFAYGSIADINITKLYLSDVYVITYNEALETETAVVYNEIDKQNVAKDSKVGELPEGEKKESKTFDGWYIINDDTNEVTNNKLTKDTIISKDISVVSIYIDEVIPEENKEEITTSEPLTNEEAEKEEELQEEKPIVEEEKEEETQQEEETEDIGETENKEEE